MLTNTTRLSWTTGPAMLMQKGRPLGQDLLTYTPPKREVMVPLTEAVSVRGTVFEQVLRQGMRFRGSMVFLKTGLVSFLVCAFEVFVGVVSST